MNEPSLAGAIKPDQKPAEPLKGKLALIEEARKCRLAATPIDQRLLELPRLMRQVA